MTTVKTLRFFSISKAPPYVTKAAFSRLYDQTHLSVYRYIYGLVGGVQQDAEDITAEVYLKAWGAREQFEGTPHAAQGWLFTIAKRIVIDRYRRDNRHPDAVSLEPEMYAAPGHSPEAHAMHDEDTKRLWALLAELDDENREIVVLRYIVGWRVQRIAAHLGIKPNTVSVRLRRTLASLKSAWIQQDIKEVAPK